MNNQLKIKTLNAILASSKEPENHAAKLKKKSLILTIISFIMLVAVFFSHFQGLVGLYLLAIAALSGMLYGFTIYLDSARKQWEFILPHIDIESVKKEVSDNETLQGA